MSTLSEVRALVRTDLRDDDAPQTFDNDELDRHIDHAVQEVSAAQPCPQDDDVTAAGDTRAHDISALTDRIGVAAVEYPKDLWPPAYVRFNLWGDVLTAHTDAEPAAGDKLRVLWTSLHTLDGSGTTLTPNLQRIVTQGAAAYALDAYASGSANKLLTAGSPGQAAIRHEANQRLAAYGRELRRLRRTIRRHTMYRSTEPAPSQDTDFGPP